MVGPKNCGDKVIEDVLITIPFPKTVATVNLEALIGTTNWDDQTKVPLLFSLYNQLFSNFFFF